MNLPLSLLLFFLSNKSGYTDFLHQHQHDQIASNRKFIYDANGNANTLNQRSANEICNLPNVYQHRFNNNQTNRTIAKPSTTKKTIKVFTNGSFVCIS